MLEVSLAAIGLLALFMSAFSRWFAILPLSPPLLALGLGAALGPFGLEVLALPPGEEQAILGVATELLLAVGLMAVALRYPADRLRRHHREVLWLLLLVLPVMALLVAAAAGGALGMTLGAAAALGAALAPTDPVLAAGVVSGDAAERQVPSRLRELLSLESGANDGLALPLVMVGLALAVGAGGPAVAFLEGLLQVGLAGVVGAGMGAGAGVLLRFSERHHDIESAARLLYTLVLAFAVLGVVELLGGNGVFGVFVAGLLHNRVVSGSDRAAEADIDEGMNKVLVLPAFTLLGVALPWAGWGALGWDGVAFVAIVLLGRRLPVVLLLARGLHLRLREAIWFGWFGPVGIAAVFYLTFLHHRGLVEPGLWEAGTLAVAVSTVLHGISAPAGRWLLRTGDDTGNEMGDDTGPDEGAGEGAGVADDPGAARGGRG
jgi:sodium/hydrogen antiporter